MTDTQSPEWVKSSFSGDQTCVEVARLDRRFGLRDSKLRDASPVLDVSAEQFRVWLDGIQAGQFG